MMIVFSVIIGVVWACYRMSRQDAWNQAIIIGGIIGLLAGGIGLTVGGIMMLIHSLVFQLASPPTAVACVGGALMMTAVGILLLLAFIWLIFGAFPAVFRWAVDLIQRVLHRGIRGGENP